MSTLSNTFEEPIAMGSRRSRVAKMPTAEQRAWMQGQLSAEFPHLSVTVEVRDGALFVGAVPA